LARTKSVDERKARMKTLFDQHAKDRASWIEKNKAFYADDRRYFSFLVPEGKRVLQLGCGIGDLLASLKPSYGVGVDFSEAMLEEAKRRFPQFEYELGDIEDPETFGDLEGPFDYVVISDTIGALDDVLAAIKNTRAVCDENTRLVVAYYSHLWEPILRLGEKFGLKMPQPEMNYLQPDDISNLMRLGGFEPIKEEWRQLIPKHWLGLGRLINNIFGALPIIRRLCLRTYVVARPEPSREPRKRSATVIIPCRNERGNIEPAITRMPHFTDDIEIIFVEGNSNDGTYEECLRIQKEYGRTWDIKVLQQDGKGKADAVWKGFDAARGDVLIILDSDLTVPPEQLPQFQAAMEENRGEFVMGTRMVYPMEDQAMRFLNWVGNRFFAKAFSFILNQHITDSLCGTKIISNTNYQHLKAAKAYFGDFDPFGDFDLIFGASKLNLKIVEVPARYRARSYGDTQISRWTNGFTLIRMVIFAWRKLKMV
jgi:ubiquinone/menaquinone biosynthesis C-methylase UbiE